MKKLKSSGTLMAIILVSLCGWVAVVGLVIKPGFWVGALLSIGGGVVIGTVVAYLIRRWWARVITEAPEEEQVHEENKHDLGTQLHKGIFRYRYACAGEDLKKGTFVEADLAGRIVSQPSELTPEIARDLTWGNVKAAEEIDIPSGRVLGWAVVDVKKGWYCWLREPPLRAKFKKEGS